MLHAFSWAFLWIQANGALYEFRSINGLTYYFLDPPEMQKSFVSMLELFDCFSKTRIQCKLKHTTIVPPFLYTRHQTIGKHFCSSSFVRRALAITAESSWRQLVVIMNWVMWVKLTKRSAAICCKSTHQICFFDLPNCLDWPLLHVLFSRPQDPIVLVFSRLCTATNEQLNSPHIISFPKCSLTTFCVLQKSKNLRSL